MVQNTIRWSVFSKKQWWNNRTMLIYYNCTLDKRGTRVTRVPEIVCSPYQLSDLAVFSIPSVSMVSSTLLPVTGAYQVSVLWSGVFMSGVLIRQTVSKLLCLILFIYITIPSVTKYFSHCGALGHMCQYRKYKASTTSKLMLIYSFVEILSWSEYRVMLGWTATVAWCCQKCKQVIKQDLCLDCFSSRSSPPSNVSLQPCTDSSAVDLVGREHTGPSWYLSARPRPPRPPPSVPRWRPWRPSSTSPS